MFESLEERRLLVLPISGSVIDLDDSPDVAFITTGNDVIEVILSGGNIQVRNSAGTVLDQRSANGVTGININVQGGNDFVRLGRADGTLIPNVPVTIRGGTGNDTLIGGNSADQLFGDADNDRLDGRAGADLLDGGAGFDTADYNYRANKVTASLTNNGAGNDGTNQGNNSSPAQYNDNGGDNAKDIEALLGGSAGDSLVGNTSANWLDGGGGNDTIYGGDGIDTITGGVSTDLAYGEGGDDFFFFLDALGDKFLGGPGTTTAQYDAALDTPAPALPASDALSESQFKSFLAEADSDLLELDESFGDDENGKVLTSIAGVLAQVNDIAIQRVEVAPDEFEEKIIVVGSAMGSSESYDFLVARYNSDGTLDTTFGEDENGIVLTDLAGDGFSDDIASSVAINEDGRLIVAGTAFKTTFVSDELTDYSSWAIAKYDADGFLDTDFGFGGIATYEQDGAISQDVAARVEIQYVFNGDTTDEEYVVAGTIGPVIDFFDLAPDSTTHDFGILRVFNNGDVDSGFGDMGLVKLDYFDNDDIGTGLAIDSETNNIWISGYSANEFNTNFLVAGYDEDGSPIPGSLLYKDFGAFDHAYDSVISGSKLLVVGDTGFGGSTSGAILAVNIAETAFPYPGQEVGSTYFFEDGSVSLRAVTLDNEGDAVAVGTLDNGSFYIHRFDTDFLSTIGETTTVEFDGDSEATAIATGVVVQEDGKIVVGGLFDDPFIALARLQDFVEPPPPPPFVDVTLSAADLQNFQFTYLDENNIPRNVPDYLVNRLKSLKPDGTVELFGTNINDNICVTQTAESVIVVLNGEKFEYPLALVTKVIIRGLDGNDYICADSTVTVPVLFDGGKGNDTLLGGKGNDELRGGAGNDSMDGGEGADDMYGDADKDTMKGGDGNDTMSAGDGDDSVDGGNNDDRISGDAGKDTLKGGNGNDKVSGGAGDDSAEGGEGNDSLFGDAGKDTVKGGGGDDQVFGGAGNDSLYGDAGRDILIGGLDADRLDGGSADDILNGGTTSYDDNAAAFSAIFAEWTRNDQNYNTRVNNIINGGGLNGSFKLNVNTVKSAANPADTLTGGQNNDLFYLASSGDRATDRASGEKVVTVHG